MANKKHKKVKHRMRNAAITRTAAPQRSHQLQVMCAHPDCPLHAQLGG